MKKQILLLTTILIVLIVAIVVMPNKTFATEELVPGGAGDLVGSEGQMSEEFKTILNEEGKFVVTNTTTSDDIESFLWYYVMDINNSSEESYYFDIRDYNAEDSTCYISLTFPDQDYTVEEHLVEVVFEEKFSDRFQSILEDGKLVLPTSSKNMDASWVETYISSLGTENYYFNIDTYYDVDTDTWNSLINDELTEATITMHRAGTSAEEKHVVELVKIAEPSEEFRKYLNEDGEIVIDSMKPSSEEDFGILFDLFIWEEDGMWWSYVSEDFSSFDMTVNNETHTVDVVYNYDKEVKEKLQEFIKNFPEDLEYFKVEDMELINYWINIILNNKEDDGVFAGYSGELKSYMSNYNVGLKLITGAGYDEPFVTGRIGYGAITYDDTAYYLDYSIGARGEHVIYVPDSTGDSKEELIAAAQKRINEYLGQDDIVTVSYAGPAKEEWAKACYEFERQWWEEENPNLTLEEWMEDSYPSDLIFDTEILGIEGVKETDDTYLVTVKVGNRQASHNIVIRKDSSKMITPTYATADVTTDVTISSTSTLIPLDTIIESEKLTSGTEYEKVIKVLNVKDNETFDLKLYSKSLNDYIIGLEEGDFQVRIPLPDKFKDKTNLKAYYVDEAEKIHEYDVEIEEKSGHKYAVFTTDHFSIYTLSEKIANYNESGNEDINSGVNNPENGGAGDEDSNMNAPTGNGGSPEKEPTNDGELDETPDTGKLDLLNYVVIITFVSALGIIALRKRI